MTIQPKQFLIAAFFEVMIIMARYNPVVITNAGQQILFRAIAGTYRIQFTEMAFGAGECADTENVAAMTELDDERQRVAVSDATISTASSVIVKARVDNSSLHEGYRVREIGIYCKNADDANSDVELYAVVIATIPDYMMEGTQDAAPMEFSYQFALGIGAASQVVIQSTANGYYTQAEVDALLTNYYTKAEIDALLNPPSQEAEPV